MSRVEWSAYYDYTEQFSGSFHDKREIFNGDALFFHDIDQHEISTGGSYRYIRDDTEGQSAFGFELLPAARSDEVVSVFIQDRWELKPDTFWLQAGVRAEHNNYSGTDLNPSLRGLWQLNEASSVWAAVSKSVRTPSRTESDGYIGGVIFIGSTSNDPVETNSYELGYRQMISPQLNLDIATFYDRETDPLSDGAGVDIHKAAYSGFEAELRYQPSTDWSLIGAFTYLDTRPDSRSGADADNAEAVSIQMQSYYQLSASLAWNALVFFNEGQNIFSSVTRLDTNIIWNINSAVELQFSLNNLLDEYHYEGQDPTRMNSAIRRGGAVRATFYF